MSLRERFSLTRRWLSLLKSAMRSPVKSPSDGNALRHFLLKPRIFDVISILLQWLDSRRLLAQSADLGDASPEGRAITHNLIQTQYKLATTTRRAEPIYQIATIPFRNLAHERLLMVGCRNILELYQAWLHGFSWRNILAIDLFSTNPKIQIMNAEDMTFPAGSFDVVTIVNTLAYCPNPLKVLGNAAHVLRPGGRLVFNYMFTGDLECFSPYAKIEVASSTAGLPVQTVHRALQGFGMRLFHYEGFEKVDRANNRGISHTLGYIKEPLSSIDPLEIAAVPAVAEARI